MTLPPPITLARLRVAPASWAAAVAVLSPGEAARMESFRHDDRRGSFAVGRLAVKTLVAERLGCPARDVVLEVRDDGSVSVPGDALHVSISHSGPEVAAVASEFPVAVDLERIKSRPASLYRFMLHPDEFELLERVPGPDDRRIALLWSIKESVLKGRRTGLRHSPKSLRINVQTATGETPALSRDGEPAGVVPAGRAFVRADDGDVWQVAYDLDPAYALSVAWRDQPFG